MKYETRVIKIAVIPKGEPIFNENVTTVEIVDEAAGEFLEVRQLGDSGEEGQIKIDPTEWPDLRAAIERMIKECR